MEKQKYYIATEGMTYKRKIDGAMVGNTLYLGKFIDGSMDTIDNYQEVIDENFQKVKEQNNK